MSPIIGNVYTIIVSIATRLICPKIKCRFKLVSPLCVPLLRYPDNASVNQVTDKTSIDAVMMFLEMSSPSLMSDAS